MAEVLFHPSFDAPLVFFWPPSDDSNYLNMRSQRKLVSNLPSESEAHSVRNRMFLKVLKNDVTMARNEFKEDSEWLISMILGNVANDKFLVT